MPSMACASNARCWAATVASRLTPGWPAGRRKVISGPRKPEKPSSLPRKEGQWSATLLGRRTNYCPLFVHPDFQGRGIGSALMSACFDDAERRNATISIVKSVLGAEEFYGRHGFLIVGPGSTTKRDVIIPDTRMARASSWSVD